jgi:hypothetical protein
MPLPRPKTHCAITLLVTITNATAPPALTAPSIASAQPASCTPTFNLFIPGTWEITEGADPSAPVGMLKPIAHKLKAEHGSATETYTLPCLASAFDNGKTYPDSKSNALTKAATVLTDTADRCTNTKFTSPATRKAPTLQATSRPRSATVPDRSPPST